MRIKTLATGLVVAVAATQAAAGPVATGFMNNDFLGDGHDRWQTGSYTQFLSFHDVGSYDFDFRMQAMVMSPWSEKHQLKGNDRFYVEVMTFGAFSNNRISDFDFVIGGDIAVIGNQTKLGDLQDGIHNWMGSDGFSPRDRNVPHIGNDLKASGMGELAWNILITNGLNVRPYMTAQAGYKSFSRMGVDLLMGKYATAAQFVRDPATGFVQPSDAGRTDSMFATSLIAGSDFSYVTSDDFLPEDHVELQRDQWRARLGFRSHYKNISVFYGATYLSEEFKTQQEGQVIGTVSLQIEF